MKAIILAGGFGTRLRPLSCTRPKMLFPVANTPLLDWTLEKLAKNKVKKTILAVNYIADAFIKRYGKKAYGMEMLYSRDVRPICSENLQPFQKLGTGGSIKKAEKLIGYKEPFFVCNGDILTNINYAEFMKTHRASDAAATIALYKVKDPSRYGVVELTSGCHIVRFVEKPTQEEAPSNLVNAGIYALDPHIFDYIAGGRPVSIEHEIFPKLAEEGKLHGYSFQGYWTDIGELSDYLKANQLLLDIEIKKELGKNVALEHDTDIYKPCIIGQNVTIGNKSKIGPYAAIGEDVTIGKEVQIENSIIFPRANISDFTSIKSTIVGEASIIGRWAKTESGCIVGDHAMIQDNVILTQGVSVCPFKEVTESVLTPKCLM